MGKKHLKALLLTSCHINKETAGVQKKCRKRGFRSRFGNAGVDAYRVSRSLCTFGVQFLEQSAACAE